MQSIFHRRMDPQVGLPSGQQQSSLGTGSRTSQVPGDNWANYATSRKLLLRYQDAQVRNPEEETETDNSELVMKKQEESSGSLSMKELTTKLVTKKQKEHSDNPSVKELEKGCGRKKCRSHTNY